MDIPAIEDLWLILVDMKISPLLDRFQRVFSPDVLYDC
jgi:hypothetical protein